LRRKYIFERMHEAAEDIAKYLSQEYRSIETTCAGSDKQKGRRLNPVTCAFRGCSWHCNVACSHDRRETSEHPWDIQLRNHILQEHSGSFLHILKEHALDLTDESLQWDLYKQALAVLERRGIPDVGVSVDRRAFEVATSMYNDKSIRSLICFCCACVTLDTGGFRSRIKYVSGRWILTLPAKCLQQNFSFKYYSTRYRKNGTPLGQWGSTRHADIRQPDFTDWTVTLDANYVKAYMEKDNTLKSAQRQCLEKMLSDQLLCCPEDQECQRNCKRQGQFCTQCWIPICKDCQLFLINGLPVQKNID